MISYEEEGGKIQNRKNFPTAAVAAALVAFLPG
jgi:hypothetical protein